MMHHGKLHKAVFFQAVLIAASILIVTPSVAQDIRDFPLPQGAVTDFTGTLTESQIDEIRLALDRAHQANSMDGFVIVALRTEEWYLDEYVKDYADFLQGRGLMNSTGWLLYISTADRKFSIAVQDAAAESITPERKQEISLKTSERLEQNDIAGAIIDSVDAIAMLAAPEINRDEKKIPPGMFAFMGMAIIVVVLMMRLRKAR